MTDCYSRFSSQGVKLGKRGRDSCLISQEHVRGCYNLSDLTHIPSAPSPRLNPKCNLTRSCFKSLADLSTIDQPYDGQRMHASPLKEHKMSVASNSWGWFVNEDF